MRDSCGSHSQHTQAELLAPLTEDELGMSAAAGHVTASLTTPIDRGSVRRQEHADQSSRVYSSRVDILSEYLVAERYG